MVQAVRKHQRVLQTGLQQRSGGNEYAGCMFVRNGVLGRITRVIASQYSSPMDPDFPEQPVPEGLDWERWCGPADLLPFNKVVWDNDSNPSWVSLRPFSGGAMVDWGAHGLDMAQWGLGMDDAGPRSGSPTARRPTGSCRVRPGRATSCRTRSDSPSDRSSHEGDRGMCRRLITAAILGLGFHGPMLAAWPPGFSKPRSTPWRETERYRRR